MRPIVQLPRRIRISSLCNRNLGAQDDSSKATTSRLVFEHFAFCTVDIVHYHNSSVRTKVEIEELMARG